MYLQMFILFMLFVRTSWEVTQIVCTKFTKKAKPPTPTQILSLFPKEVEKRQNRKHCPLTDLLCGQSEASK